MSIEHWITTPEAYFAVMALITFAMALWHSINSILISIALFIEFASPTDVLAEVKWGRSTLQMTLCWALFAAYKYLMAVAIR